MHGVLGRDRAYGSVGEAHCRVGVGILGRAFRFAHLVDGVGVAEFLLVGVDARRLLGLFEFLGETPRADRIGHRRHRVGEDLLGRAGLCEPGAELFVAGAAGVFERVVDQRRNVALETVVKLRQLLAPHFAGHVVDETLHHPCQHLLVGGQVEVLHHPAGVGLHAREVLVAVLHRGDAVALHAVDERAETVGRHHHVARANPRLLVVALFAHGFGAGLVAFFEVGEQVAVFGVDPGGEARLLGGADADNVVTAQADVLPLGVVGVVADVEILVAVHQPHVRVGLHVAQHDVEAVAARLDHHGVGHVLLFAHGLRRHVAVGAARKADHHGVVPVVDATRRDIQHLAGRDGHVVLRVGRRAALRVAVDAVEGEIARVLGPAPVVLLAAEGPDFHGRRTHEAHVLIGLVVEKQVFLALPHRGAFHFEGGVPAVLPFEDAIDLARPEDAQAVGLFERVADGLGLVRHVADLPQEGHGLALERQFVLLFERPEALFEVVLRGGAQRVDVAVGHMVVGDDESLVRNHAARAHAAVDGHDGVAQRRGLLVVNLSGFEFQPLLLHLGVDHVPERADQPHAFVGRRRNREQDAGQQVKNRFFHRLLGLSRKKGLAYHKPRWCQRVCPSVLKVNFGSSSLSVPSLYFTGHTLALSSSFQIFASSHIDLT